LWFDRPVMSEPFLTLLEHTTQWIFNKTRLYGDAQSNGQYLQLVVSASHDLVARSRQDIIDLCRRELADVLPATRDAALVRATVIKEVNATFSPAPDSDRWRLPQRTALRNLFLAGDWTRTGWPATMESAVRSGYLAAEAILEAQGRRQRILRDDLPVEGLARRWA
ncbi:MAG TPA: FAD-dependent oxidoreductase, partial [Candidatus Acidoferrales bacterium]